MEKRIKHVAMLVRDAVTKHAKQIGLSDNLGGTCAIASFTLARILCREGIPAFPVVGYCYGGGHCWVEVCGKVVDITATQFKEYEDKPYLAFGIAEKEYNHYLTTEMMNAESTHRLADWPDYQRPHEHLIVKLVEEVTTLACG
jgi:hypothetical protein